MNNQDKVPNSMDDIFNLIRGMTSSSTSIARVKVEDFTVSTVNSADMGPGTAICSDKKVYPVERYDDINSTDRMAALAAEYGFESHISPLQCGNRLNLLRAVSSVGRAIG